MPKRHSVRDSGRILLCPERGPQSHVPCHQFDYIYTWFELRLVVFTAAAQQNGVVPAIDATDCSSISAKLPAVYPTAAG